ncbi:MAG: Arginine deiminase [Anaerolineales bacterium]|nr:Arginine deiminase [Anaerolineales bacterium]
MQPQVFDETHPLEEALVWGEPGIEALLGQLLPKSKSLFFSYYEVLEARKEFRYLRSLVENEGIRFTQAKDAMVQRLKKTGAPGEPSALREVENLLLARADAYYETYREEKQREFELAGNERDFDDVYQQIQQDIKRILREDEAAYGERAATRLNHLLSLAHELPLANIFYGRDQSQALTDKLVLSSVKWEIRKPEVAVFKQALVELGYQDSLVEIERGTFEGGDVAMFDQTCFVGVGARTSLSAVEDLAQKIGPVMDAYGVQVAAVVNQRHEREAEILHAPNDEHMHLMHLDMFWIPLEPKLVMAYTHEVDQRRVLRVAHKQGQTVMEDLGGFRHFMSERGIEIIEVDRREQENFATNLLNLGGKKVIVALSTNKRVIAELEARGYRVLSAELNKLVGGYGATHCLTAPIRRTL